MNLEEIKARCKAATGGPWKATWLKGVPAVCIRIGDMDVGICLEAEVNDAEFIVHAREDVPALIAEVEWLQSRLVRAHRMLLDDLAILWPEPGSPVEQLKAKLLHELQEYLEEDNG